MTDNRKHNVQPIFFCKQDHVPYAIIWIPHADTEDIEDHGNDWRDVLYVRYEYETTDVHSRVVKARHWYDLSVIKDQNRHVKDKYVIQLPWSNQNLGYIWTLESVNDMPEE